MRVLVVGGTRFVGYLLAWRLVAAGHQVTLFNRGTASDPFGDRVERLHGDRTTEDFARLLAGREWDAAVDFAAYTGEDAVGALRVLSGRAGHYVFISTGQVYLVREGCPVPAREEDYDGPVLPEPTDPSDRDNWRYGAGKRDAEDALVRAWETERFPATRLRIPIVNGERDYYRRIESYLWRILDGRPLLVPNGGTRPCRHVYGAEVARAVAELLGRTDTFGQAYNLCQDEAPLLPELLGMLAEILGAQPELLSVPRERIEAAGIPVREVSPFSGRWMSHLDPSRAQRELGFRHAPLRSYLERIVTCFLAHPPADPPEGYRHREAELRLLNP